MVNSVVEATEVAAAASTDLPFNLPTGNVSELHFTPAMVEEAEAEEAIETLELSAAMKELEDRAHAQHVLLSSDAMRHFIGVCKDGIDRVAFLDRVVTDAKVSYPSEDGWVVLNLERMQELCVKRNSASPDEIFVAPKVMVSEEKKVMPAVPVGVGSLAEAIVKGDIQSAYKMVESRPMVALLDAASDLDAVYRMRHTGTSPSVGVSQMLQEDVVNLSDEQLSDAIAALTGAIDGTYTDEVEAVKMALVRAIKAVS